LEPEPNYDLLSYFLCLIFLHLCESVRERQVDLLGSLEGFSLWVEVFLSYLTNYSQHLLQLNLQTADETVSYLHRNPRVEGFEKHSFEKKWSFDLITLICLFSYLILKSSQYYLFGLLLIHLF
uniref:Uncharacterized protein n=1 Tax=Dromaius novaehollandiae TaxID=8790 RepID=A0A8C4KQP2_DRONO